MNRFLWKEEAYCKKWGVEEKLKVAFGVSVVFLVLEVGHNVNLIHVKVGKKESNVGEKEEWVQGGSLLGKTTWVEA